MNLLIAQSNNDRNNLRNEIEKIKAYSLNKKNLSVEEIKSIANFSGEYKSDSLINEADNAGLDLWIQNSVDGKVNNCWKRMHDTWSKKLMNDDSFTDPIPSVQADFVAMVIARPEYKTRKARDDAAE